jgi:hypothetical protein
LNKFETLFANKDYSMHINDNKNIRKYEGTKHVLDGGDVDISIHVPILLASV